MNWVIQGIGVVGMLFGILSFQFKRHKDIVLLKMASELVFVIQYFMLGAWTAAAMNLISGVRNYAFYKLVKKHISTVPVIILFCIIVLITGYFTFEDSTSLIPICSKILTTVSYGIKNEKWLRRITVPSCAMWIIYNILIGSIAGIMTDTFALVSLLVAMYKFDIKVNKKIGNVVK